MAVDWSALPIDLVAAIALKLETFEDFIYFSVVCRSWNHVSSLIKHQWRPTPVVPWLLLAENTKQNPDCIRKIYNLDNNNCYKFNLPETFGARCWGLACGWVVVVYRDFNVQLFNPITKARIRFPSLEALNNLTWEEGREEYVDWFLRCFLNKFIVLKVCESDRNEFVIVVICDNNKRLAFARHGDQSWTSIFTKEEEMAETVDVVGMDDNVYALYGDGSIVYWNVKDFFGLELVKPKDYSPGELEILEGLNDEGIGHIYLVQSGSDLLMVLRYKEHVGNADGTDYNYDIVYQTVFFRVYKLKPEDRSWEEIEDLGEVALFLGVNSSISVGVTHAKGLQRSCIYFTDDEY